MTRIKSSLLAAAVLLLAANTATAQQSSQTFVNPCDRGPVPEWEVINQSRSEFVSFLQQVRPRMPLDVAEKIASDLCNDMSLLGDSAGLTRRTNLLIRQAGY